MREGIAEEGPSSMEVEGKAEEGTLWEHCDWIGSGRCGGVEKFNCVNGGMAPRLGVE